MDFKTTMAQTQLTFKVTAIEKVCNMSVADTKAYLLSKGFIYWDGSDDTEDGYVYNKDGVTIVVEKMKQINEVKFQTSFKKNWTDILESLTDLGFHYELTDSRAEPTMTFYRSGNYRLTLFITKNDKSKSEDYNFILTIMN